MFFGSSTFGERPLRAFAETVDCVLVVTQPDRPAKRGKRLQPTPVKATARDLRIPTLEPARVRDAFPALRETGADIFAVAAYGQILPPGLLALPRLAPLNVHPSLLPLYRGAAPLQAQLRDGVQDGGVTITIMDAGMDTGDIVLQERLTIEPCWDFGRLHERCSLLGAEMLALACRLAGDGQLQRRPQRGLASEAEVARTRTHVLRKEELVVSPQMPAARQTVRGLIDHIRAFAPEPGARIMLYPFRPSFTTVFAAHQIDNGPSVDVEPGNAVLVRGWILIRARDGWLVVDRLVVPGRRPTNAEAFRLGYPLTGPQPFEGALDAWYEAVGRGVLRVHRKPPASHCSRAKTSLPGSA